MRRGEEIDVGVRGLAGQRGNGQQLGYVSGRAEVMRIRNSVVAVSDDLQCIKSDYWDWIMRK